MVVCPYLGMHACAIMCFGKACYYGIHACVDMRLVDAEWLSGRMPDSRAREHHHESSYGLHIGAVDGDSLWRCYAMTTQNHCTCYFVINRDFYYFIYYDL